MVHHVLLLTIRYDPVREVEFVSKGRESVENDFQISTVARLVQIYFEIPTHPYRPTDKNQKSRTRTSIRTIVHNMKE